MALRRLIVLLGLSLVSVACDREERQAASAPPVQPAPKPVAPLPVAEPPMSRAELLLALAHAASDYAVGKADESRQRQLDGKRFQVAFRFGCAGDDLANRSVRFDPKTNVLRLQVSPELSREASAVQDLSLAEIEAVEGFWIRRPWILEASCPRPMAAPQPSPAPDRASNSAPKQPQTAPRQAELPRLGLAQFYSATDTRTTRRDSRAYEVTKRLDDGTRPSSRGYDLVVSGRLKKLSNGRVLACSGSARTEPPACIASAEFDHVAILDPETRTTLAEWSGS